MVDRYNQQQNYDPMSIFQNPQNAGNIMGYQPQSNAYNGFMALGGNQFQPQNNGFNFYNTQGVAPPNPSAGFMDVLKTPRGLAAGAQGIAALGSVFLGLKSSRLAKDQLNFQKDAFTKQYDMQVEDRKQSAARRKASATGVSQY